MIKRILPVAALLAGAAAARAQDFDYYLLALTWTPSFCQTEGGERNAEQCDPARGLGFTLHGLWPQFEDGWPEFCDSPARDPSRRETTAMADVMGSGDLAWYQWKKHGRCAGLSADAYFAAARRAFAAVVPPQIAAPETTASGLEAAFLDANPALGLDGVVVTCREDMVREVRICLDRNFAPRDCGADVLRDGCASRGPLEMPPVP